MLREAVIAVHWSSFSRPERNFTFLSAVCAGCLVHFTGTVKGSPLSAAVATGAAATVGAPLSAFITSTTATAPIIVSVVHEINSERYMSYEIIDIRIRPIFHSTSPDCYVPDNVPKILLVSSKYPQILIFWFHKNIFGIRAAGAGRGRFCMPLERRHPLHIPAGTCRPRAACHPRGAKRS